MHIRSVERIDTAEWSRMRSLLWPEALDAHAREIGDYFTNHSIDIVQVFVIERPDAAGLAGFIEINLRDFAEGSRSSPIPYIEGWFVDADCRGQGYGRQLVQQAEQWAVQSGFDELASDVEIDNQGSIEVHRQMGFRETYRIVCFIKSLHRPE